jgi:hypothetical protein
MSKTHKQVIETAEARLLKAMTTCDKTELRELVHPDFVLGNENGEVFLGIDQMQINEPNLLRIKTLEIKERSISLFNNVAIVNSYEMRTGDFRGMHFEGQYRITRVWKFTGRSWCLISANLLLL